MEVLFTYAGKIFTAEEQKERAAKALAVALNGFDFTPTLFSDINTDRK